MADRVSKLRRKIVNQNIKTMLITRPENITYLVGFTGSNGMLLITEDQLFLLTDFRYKEQAGEEASSCEIIIYRNSGLDELSSLLKKLALKTLGFESHAISYKKYHELGEKLRMVELKPAAEVVEALRAAKEEREIRNIARAAGIGDEAFRHILLFIKPGLTEREVALELEYFMRKKGAEKASFDIIVASGARSSMPHARTSDKLLETGEFVKLDFGAVCGGYCSDMTRTVVLGKATYEQKRIYKLVLEAQRRVYSGIRPGRLGKQVDKIARDYFKEEGYLQEFGHNLGHGVGLEVHESPTLGPKSEEVLEENMVVTVEPGLYLPELGGVRIEDLVVLKKDGAKVLTKSPKKLIEL